MAGVGRARGRALAGALALALLAACGGERGEADDGAAASSAPARIHDGPHDLAVITMAQPPGEIRIELLPEIAPRTVESFTHLADDGFFDGTTFHRVIPDFMIQGGCPNTRSPDPRQHGKGDPGYSVPDEFSDVPHVRGTVSMANKSVPNTAGSQFFIVLPDEASFLDGKYTVFGRVVEGMDVVDAITELEIDKYGRYGPKDRPYPVDARVESIRIERAESAG